MVRPSRRRAWCVEGFVAWGKRLREGYRMTMFEHLACKNKVKPSVRYDSRNRRGSHWWMYIQWAIQQSQEFGLWSQAAWDGVITAHQLSALILNKLLKLSSVLLCQLEWVTIPFSRVSSLPRDQTQVSSIAGRFFII